MPKDCRTQFHCQHRFHQLQSQSSKGIRPCFLTRVQAQVGSAATLCDSYSPFRGAQDHCLLVLCPIDINLYKRRGSLFTFSASRCRGFYPGCVLGHSWEEVVKGKSLATWQSICVAPIHGHFPFSLSHAALLLFFSLSQVQDPNSISANTTVMCIECQIQRKKAEDFGRLHRY